MEDIMNFWIGQMFSIMALISATLSTQLKSVKHILVMQIVSNLTMALSFLFLGGMSGAWVCIVAIFQTSIMYMLNKRTDSEKYRRMLMIGFVLIYIAGTAMVYQSWEDIVSCTCAVFYVLAIVQKETKKYRRFIFVNSFLWLIYDVSTMAYVNVVTHGILLVSLIIAMIRFDLKKSET